jgi:hypothetical protein
MTLAGRPRPKRIRTAYREEERKMKRYIFTLLMVLVVVAMGTTLMAQTPTTGDQRVDQSGQPETGPGPDVDVDTGAAAEDGVADVDVKSRTDADTAAQGNDDATDTTAGMNDTDNDNLPDTGSELPLVGMLGLLSLAGAVALRANR